MSEQLIPERTGTAGRAQIHLRGVRKSFAGRTVVDVDDLVWGAHPVEGLIGPNGAGKTTLMRLIMRSMAADSGTIELLGATAQPIDLRRTRDWQIPLLGLSKSNQVITDFDNLTILDSLLLSAARQTDERPHTLRGESRLYERHRGEIDEMLEIFGIADPIRLAQSAGEKKLVDIMRCLLLRPSFLLLDEPTAGLSPEMTDRVVGAVRALADQGTSVVIVEHDLNVVWNLCQQVTFMAAGRVLLQGPPDEVRSHATVIENYLGEGHV